MEINQKICNPEIYLKYLSMNIYVINQNCIRKKNMINQIKKNSKISSSISFIGFWEGSEFHNVLVILW